MDDPVKRPGDGGGIPDTNPVPAIAPDRAADPFTATVRAVVLPLIEPLGTDTLVRDGVLDVRLVRAVHDQGLDALEALAVLECRSRP